MVEYLMYLDIVHSAHQPSLCESRIRRLINYVKKFKVHSIISISS